MQEYFKRTGREIKKGVKELPGNIKKGFQDAKKDLREGKGRGKKKPAGPENPGPSS